MLLRNRWTRIARTPGKALIKFEASRELPDFPYARYAVSLDCYETVIEGRSAFFNAAN